MKCETRIERRVALWTALLPLAGLQILTACAPAGTPIAENSITLSQGWQLASGDQVADDPTVISFPGYAAESWTSTTVPSTVLAALVRAGEYEKPYYARNLETIPTTRFEQPWWYRTEFTLDEPVPAGARLVFEGINYRADIWLNGNQIGSQDEIFGAFRMFEIEVADYLQPGINALAVRVHPPQPGDPSIGFVDWNPRPPDRNMGLWREVRLRLHGGIALDDVFVHTDIDLETFATADLTVEATLRNDTSTPMRAVFKGAIGNTMQLEHPVELAAGESRRIVLTPDEYPQLSLQQPRLWWPNNMGSPYLYQLDLSVTAGREISDQHALRFGLRHVDDYLTEDGYRGYTINGKKLLIRGGGWVDDLMLADDDQRLEDQIRYVRHMNLNTIRLEGFWGSSHRLFDMADQYGILVMVGWSCQWEWEDYLEQEVDEYGGIDTPEEMELITRSLGDQVRWLRNHPSVFVWVLASDMLPRPALESRYREALAEVDPSRPALAACAVAESEVSGPTGVKMNGPYDWVPPLYWFVDQERGGAYGFNTETSPGPQPPPIESIQRMMPEENWWPVDDMWDYHSGRNQFNTIDNYHAALDARYGKTTSLEDFARKAQLANYEGVRAMFEAFSIRRPKTTGLIQWMLNSAWPEMYWQLYDHYLVPNGAFYGARDASRPINIALDRADHTIVVVNDTGKLLPGAVSIVRVFDFDSQLLWEDTRELDVPAETLVPVLTVNPASTPGGAYFLDARLTTPGGKVIASSLYWLAEPDDAMDWEASEWYYTPTSRFADFSALAELPAVELEVEHRFKEIRTGTGLEATLANPSDKIAFFVELSVVGAESGQLLTPIFWSHNYVSLLPGEERGVWAEIPTHALGGETPVFRYSGINVTAD